VVVPWDGAFAHGTRPAWKFSISLLGSLPSEMGRLPVGQSPYPQDRLFPRQPSAIEVKPGILWAMATMRNHEKMKDLWPPKFEMPHGFWDTYHPGGEWGILYQVKWIEPNRKGELPFVKVIVRWNDVDFRTVFSSDDTVFLKGLYETLRTRGVGHSLEDVGNLIVDF
jgi:hypothetical protein